MNTIRTGMVMDPIEPVTAHAKASVGVCDCCQRVETEEGRWEARQRADQPPLNLAIPDFCPECCSQYVSLLLTGKPGVTSFNRMSVERRKSVRQRSAKGPASIRTNRPQLQPA